MWVFSSVRLIKSFRIVTRNILCPVHVCLHHRQHISYSLEQRGREKWVLSKHFRFFIYINIKYQILIYLLCSFLMVSNLLATLLKMLMMMTLTLMMVVFIFFLFRNGPTHKCLLQVLLRAPLFWWVLLITLSQLRNERTYVKT